MRRLGWLGMGAVALSLVWAAGVEAQAPAATIVSLPVPLLGPKMGSAVRVGEAVGGEDATQADAAHAAALVEDGLQRFSTAHYAGASVEAMQFNDASGARAAYSLYTSGGTAGPKLGEAVPAGTSALVNGRTIVLAQTVVLLAEKGAAAGTLQQVVSALPKIGGPRSERPLLPTLLPERGLVNGSARYAIGPAGYAAEGGVLDAAKLGWEKSGEAVTADYADRRGKESLTLLLYPTPQIAGEHMRSLETELGASGAGVKVRREGELVAVAQGSFKADDAQNLVENVHLRSVVTFDKPMPLEFQTEVRKTYSLMKSIAIMSGVGGLAAVMLGLFLGGGRAAFRVMRGKDAATDMEFLSLHLDPKNAPPKFEQPDPPAPGGGGGLAV